jgi:hypothetical protein
MFMIILYRAIVIFLKFLTLDGEKFSASWLLFGVQPGAAVLLMLLGAMEILCSSYVPVLS